MEDQKINTSSQFTRQMKRARKFAAWLFIILIVLITSAITLGFIFEDKVKEAVMDRLGEYLNTRVYIDPKNIDFSFIRDFPMASLQFKNVKAMDATRQAKKDTLFSASVISFQFNIMDIIHKKYHVKKISVENASVKVWINKKGEDNYHFWKESIDKKAKEKFSFSLENVELEKISFSFINHKKKLDYAIRVNKVEFGGAFSSENYTLDGNADLFVYHLKEDSINYLTEKNILSDYSLEVKKNTYTIKKGIVETGDLQVRVSGAVLEGQDGTLFDLLLKGQELNIQSVLSLLPEKQKQKFNDYNSTGEFYLEASIKGLLSRNSNPAIASKFGIENAEITQASSSITLSNVSLKGEYSSPLEDKPDILSISRFSATLEKGFLKGNFKLSKLTDPHLELTASASMNIADAKNLFKIDTLEVVSGNISVNLFYKGKFPRSISLSKEELNSITTSGELLISGASITFKNNHAQFDSVNTSLLLNNKDVTLNFLRGQYLSSDFMIKGVLKNFVPWILLGKEKLNIEATFRSSNLNLNELLSDESKSSKKDTVYRLALPEHIELKLNTDIDHITFRKFEARDLKGKIALQNRKLIAEPLTFKAMDGIISMNGFIDASREKEILVSCETDIQQINITKLFSQLENFGQSTMEDKNLKGTLTSDIIFASVWSPDLTIDPSKAYALCNITIERGELINFEPMKALSRYIKVSELEHIRFSTMKNQVEIKNKKIIIPRMEVNSNAINVSGYGTHSFNNEIDYHIKVLLSELLSQKAKKDKKENVEFAEEEEQGRTSLFLSMTGTVDKPIIHYDRKESVGKLKEDLKTEKQTLKTILKEEFGWFKKDTLPAKKAMPKKSGDKFILEWDENKPAEKKEEEN